MTARKLLQLLNIDVVDNTNLITVAKQLEEAVLQSDLFDEDVIESFRKSALPSKNGNQRYVILPEDLEVIKNAKAIINLLYTFQASLQIVNPALDAVHSPGWFGMAWNALKTAKQGAAAVLFGSEVSNATEDIKAFRFYVSQLKRVLTHLPEVNSSLSSTMDQLSVSSPVTIYKAAEKVRKEQQHAKATSQLIKVPEIQSLIENTNILLAGNDDQTLKALLTDILEKFQRIADFQNNHPDEKLTWDKVDPEYKKSCIALMGELKSLCHRYRKLGAKELNNQYMVIKRWSNKSAAAKNLHLISETLNVTDSLNLVLAAVTSQIDKKIHDIHYDTKTKLYVYTPHDELPKATQYAMLAANIATKANDLYLNIDKLQHASYLGQVPVLIDLSRLIGEMMNEISDLHVDEGVRANLDSAVKQIFDRVLPIYQKFAMIACESEIALGMRDNALVAKLQPLSDLMTKIANEYEVELDITYPFDMERFKVINSILPCLIKEHDQYQKVYQALDALVLPDQADFTELLHLEALAHQIDTLEAYELRQTVTHVIKEINGMNALEREIAKHEHQLTDYLKEKGFLDDNIEGLEIDDRIAEMLTTLRSLYADRDLLDNVMQRLKNAKDGDSKVLPFYWDGEIKQNEEPQARINKAYKIYEEKIEDLFYAVLDSTQYVIEAKEKKIALLTEAQHHYAEQLKIVMDDNAAKPAALEEKREEKPSKKVEKKLGDNDLIKAIILQKNGPIVSSMRQIRKYLQKIPGKFLDDEQNASLRRVDKDSNLYEMVGSDSMLTVSIKRMHNVTQIVEKISREITAVQHEISSGGHGAIVSVVKGGYSGSIAAIKIVTEYKLLLNELHGMREALKMMSATMDIDALASHPKITKYLEMFKSAPAYIQGFMDSVPVELAAVFSPADQSVVKDLVDSASDCAKLATEMSVVKQVPVKQYDAVGYLADTYTDYIKAFDAFVKPLVAAIPKDTPKSGGIYVTNQMKEGKDIAILVNAGTYLQRALENMSQLGRGSGLGTVISLQKNVGFFKAELRKLCVEGFVVQNPQAKRLFDFLLLQFVNQVNLLKSNYKHYYAHAAVSEKLLGLKPGLLTSYLDVLPKVLVEFADEFSFLKIEDKENNFYYQQVERMLKAANVQELADNVPFSGTQLTVADGKLDTMMKAVVSSSGQSTLAQGQMTRLLSMVEQLSREDDAKPEVWSPPLDFQVLEDQAMNADPFLTAKIEMLNNACQHYLVDLANLYVDILNSINKSTLNDLMKKREYQVNANNPIALMRLIIRDDPKDNFTTGLDASVSKARIIELRKVREKFVAVSAMQDTVGPASVNINQLKRLNAFRETFTLWREHLDDGKDGRFTRFVKLIVNILYYGFGAALRMWRTHNIADKVKQTNAVDERPRKIPRTE